MISLLARTSGYFLRSVMVKVCMSSCWMLVSHGKLTSIPNGLLFFSLFSEQVVVFLWILSVIGSFFSFFTLAYIGMILDLSGATLLKIVLLFHHHLTILTISTLIPPTPNHPYEKRKKGKKRRKKTPTHRTHPFPPPAHHDRAALI